MKKQIRVTVNNRKHLFPRGTKIGVVLEKTRGKNAPPFQGAILHNRLVDTDYVLNQDCSIRAVDYHSREGLAIYRRSAILILIEAVHQIFPGKRLVIGQSIADGYYFDLHLDRALSGDDIERISNRMQRIVRNNRRFTKKYLPYDEAKIYFENQGLEDKVKLLDYLRTSEICVVSCGKFQEIYSGPLCPSTGIIEIFSLEPYQEGMVLRFPSWKEGRGWKLGPARNENKLFNVYRETRHWNKILGVENVGMLNDLIVGGEIKEMIVIAETLHEKKIAAIADRINSKGSEVKLILIAGPSSSGKTTFAKRLMIDLKVNGYSPIALSMDNYFHDRDKTPRGPDGEYDFEALEALDLDLFNSQLQDLMAGKSVRPPVFDFKIGQKSPGKQSISLRGNTILIIEGIHGLNDRVSEAVRPEMKFKIYVSALTQLCVDDHNRIFTSDTRLLRRIVRDRKYRGWSATQTIQLWPAVRRGENRNIFPFQENADVMFNSALIYEQAVLKHYAERALLEVTPGQKEYMEAARLLGFLSFFAPLSELEVPSTSILREFIGGSFFDY